MKNNYKASTLMRMTKAELVDYAQCLQNNLKVEEDANIHMYATVSKAMSKDHAFSDVVGKILNDWNDSKLKKHTSHAVTCERCGKSIPVEEAINVGGNGDTDYICKDCYDKE